MKTITSYLLSPHFLRNCALEFGPIGLFAFLFYIRGPYVATLLLMVTTLISTFIAYSVEKRIPLIALYVTLLTLLFGYMTLHKRNIEFLQIRDTIYDFTLALTILVAFLFNKNVLKIALSSFISLSDAVWKRLSYAWVVFFLIAAMLNEYVRRTHSMRDWFDFKVVMMFVTTVFAVSVLYFFARKEMKE